MLELDLQNASTAQSPSEAQFRHWCELALRQRTADSELTIRLVDEAEARELNHTYRQKDYATNVLTFDYSHEPVVVADLILCAPVVEAEAATEKVTLEAHYAHLLVHGTLHAQGHDHEDEDEAQEMEARETEVLAGLGFADPYSR